MVDEYNIEMNSELFDTDLDEVGWEPEVLDDSDNNSADIFGYK